MTQSMPRTTTQRGERALGGVRFDWAAALLNLLLVGGAYNDAWAHEHGKVDDSFFTLWHGLLYGAMLLVAIFLVATVVRNRRHGYPWQRALPEGYALSLVGVGIFALGGFGDMIWHAVFGIEVEFVTPSPVDSCRRVIDRLRPRISNALPEIRLIADCKFRNMFLN